MKTHHVALKCIAAFLLIASLALSACQAAPPPTPTAAPTNTVAPTPVFTPTPSIPTFSKDKGLDVAGSATTGKGEISFEPGASPNTIKITLNGDLPVTDQKAICWFCLDTIRIAPGLQIPVEWLGAFELDKTAKMLGNGSLDRHLKLVEVNGVKTVKNPPEVERITYTGIILEHPLPASSTNAIIAGPQGAVLKKDGKLLFLVEGAATLQH